MMPQRTHFIGTTISGLTLLACLLVCGCTGKPIDSEVELRVLASRDRAALLLRGTPNSLAAAALLSDPSSLAPGAVPAEIQAATAAAPREVGIAWLEYVLCLRTQCKTLKAVEGRLKQLDPENGWVWVPNLNRALAENDSAAVTEALNRIANTDRMTVYWNPLLILVTDELGYVRGATKPGDTGHSLEERSTLAVGLLSSVIPPLHSFAQACEGGTLDEQVRRRACEEVTARLVKSEEAITQGLGLSLQARLAKADPLALERVREQRRQFDYLVFESSRPHFFGRSDTALRLETARNTTSESDVMRAVLTARHKPLQPPPGWKSSVKEGQ
jgi:hypothetical protein